MPQIPITPTKTPGTPNKTPSMPNKTPSMPNKTPCTSRIVEIYKNVNLHSKILIYAVLTRDDFCREFTHFFGVPFTGLKNMVAYQKWQLSGIPHHPDDHHHHQNMIMYEDDYHQRMTKYWCSWLFYPTPNSHKYLRPTRFCAVGGDRFHCHPNHFYP